MKNTQKPQPLCDQTRTAVCRSCGCEGNFTFAGTQEIPPHVAHKMGMELERFTLWNCPHCGTTLSEMSLG